MNKTEFKKEYLTDAFFFVHNREEFETLQRIAIEFGLKDPIGGTGFIEYDMHNLSTNIAPEPNVNVAHNLTFFPDGRYQQSSFWIRGASYGKPKKYDRFLQNYNNLEA